MKWAATTTATSWNEGQSAAVAIPWPELERVIRPRGGHCVVVIAAPGVGKTTLILNWAAFSGARTLYMSADTSAQDITLQLASLAVQEQRDIVEHRLKNSALWRELYAKAVASDFPNLVVDPTPRPSMTQIRRKLLALTELWGRTPELLVLDTASDIAPPEGKSEQQMWRELWLECRQLAREFNLVVVLAHHVKVGMARDGRVAPQMSDGLWGSDTYAEIVLGLHVPAPHELTVTVRKNRGGRRDVPVQLEAHLERCLITSPQPSLQGVAA